MPVSRKYCLSKSPDRMGFSQRSSCKAQGYIRRSSGRFVVSPKYKKQGFSMGYRKVKSRVKSRRITRVKSRVKSRRITRVKSRVKSRRIGSKINLSLYDNGKKTPRIVSGYRDKKKALQTIRNLKGQPYQYKMSIVNTMYNRAKYHRNQTRDMKEAMKVFKEWKAKNRK